MKELHSAVREGDLSEDEARREEQEMRRNLQREIHLAHREIDLETNRKKINQAVEKVI